MTFRVGQAVMRNDKVSTYEPPPGTKGRIVNITPYYIYIKWDSCDMPYDYPLSSIKAYVILKYKHRNSPGDRDV